MATYNIPGITTSLIDNSYLKTNTFSGRSVLVAGFSKYGSEEITSFSDIEVVKAKLGLENIKKFGLGVKYVKGALTKTNKVLWKRLVSPSATYANNILGEDLKFYNISTTDKKILTDSNLDIDGIKSAVILYAKERGLGYNDLSIKFSPAEAFEKMYSDDEGNLEYRFNFLNATIYEASPKGPVIVENNILISLLDRDPNTGVPILNINTGVEMFCEKYLPRKNEFVNMKINPKTLESFYTNINLREITESQGGKVILTDKKTNKNFELFVENGKLIIKATAEAGKDEVILNLISTDNTGAVITKKYSVSVTDSQIGVAAYYGTDAGKLDYKLNGSDAFYKLYIDDNEALATSVINFSRFDIYNALIDSEHRLGQGSDGENVIINGNLNLMGPGDSVEPNAKQLLLQFFNEDSTIREVMYPKFDFDYIPDWTNDFDVQTAIVNLADEIGFTIPVTSLGLSMNAKEDVIKRQQDFYVNSFNTLIYSGQTNLNHFDEGSGSYIAIPHSYMALLINLKIDAEYSITEPPANINKGSLLESSVVLSYSVTSGDIEKLRNMQVNTIIEEIDGTYEIDQLTAYKKSSKLSRINVIKPIHRMRKDIPKLLKGFLQVKSLGTNITEITKIVTEYMNKYKVSSDNAKDGIFQEIKINVYFIEEENHLVVSILINPVGTIETISVPIQVK